ncbi:LOW QUALITY PROTEIN: hypothetical protein HID58_067001 [Brassica napus]|uniref:Uncharacterized protein n=1 Tax=Brassica napus TaxID=3708 RepID=A0ABQ7ZHP4_BRANA|nr:LOW QUALITY PROTEIN: hypothetical protein HID58_067001 [Brassica napus]
MVGCLSIYVILFSPPKATFQIMEAYLFGGGSKIGLFSCCSVRSGMGLGFKCFVALCTCPDLVAVARPRALLHKRHGKSRHPRQQGEPHILVMFVKGGEQ